VQGGRGCRDTRSTVVKIYRSDFAYWIGVIVISELLILIAGAGA
jgi:hypothetical protein